MSAGQLSPFSPCPVFYGPLEPRPAIISNIPRLPPPKRDRARWRFKGKPSLHQLAGRPVPRATRRAPPLSIKLALSMAERTASRRLCGGGKKGCHERGRRGGSRACLGSDYACRVGHGNWVVKIEKGLSGNPRGEFCWECEGSGILWNLVCPACEWSLGFSRDCGWIYSLILSYEISR